jgi:hypothetical protein
MFVGMSFCLPLAFLLESQKRKRAQKAAAAAVGTASEPLLADGVSKNRLLPAAAKQRKAMLHSTCCTRSQARQAAA